MAGVLTVTSSFEAVTCCSCGVVFAMTAEMNRKRMKSGERFYCPNGHGQAYTDTDARKIKQLEQRLEVQRKETERARDQRDSIQRSLSTTRGHVTRLRKKLEQGFCPFCDHQFADVKAHMELQHPGMKLPGEDDAEDEAAGIS